MRPAFAALIVCTALATPARADLRNFEDAALHAVQFVDDNEGWAVGDEGVIWHTVDGGAAWERQPTGCRASLRSLHFLTPYTGWVAGRQELPGAQGSQGVLLYTRDGGLSWQRVDENALPGLNHVRFVDNTTGFVAGDGTEQFPTGLFKTTDSGRTWQPVAGSRRPAWLAGSFQDGQNGALAGAWGSLYVLRQGRLLAAEMDPLGGRAVNGIQVVGDRAVAVGQGGLVLVSRDSAGARWGYADLKLSPEVRAAWDFHALHWAGDHVWAVGRPGSAVLHSPDRGQTWQVLPTGQALPLNGVYSTGGRRAWAVGELGSILGTDDGGATWRVERRGGQRAALLLVQGRPTRLPVDTLALVGGDDGYLAGALQVFASDPATSGPERSGEALRFAAAARLAGGAAGETLWQFPLPQHLARSERDDLLRHWNGLHGGRASDQLLRQLVLALRTWRPDVVLTDHPDAAVNGMPAESLVTEVLREALSRAADPQSFPEQIRILGLEPWQVRKVYCRWEDRTSANVVLDLTQVNARLEGAPRDFASNAAALLVDLPWLMPNQRLYHLTASTLPDAAGHKFLMQGIDLAPGGAARRKGAEVTELAPELEKALRTRRNLVTLAETPAGELTDPNRLIAQVGPMLRGLPEGQAAPTTFAVANRFVRTGQWAMAREMFLLLAQRYPTHPLAVEANRWLIRLNASSEARRRHELGQFWTLTETTLRLGAEAPRPAELAKLNSDVLKLEAAHRQDMGLLGSRQDAVQWYRESVEQGKRLAALGTLAAGDPATQFCLQAARRNLGEFEAARQWYTKFCGDHTDGPWRDAAASELWLLSRTGSPRKPILYCRSAASRPYLDGEFDDDCWETARPVTLQTAAGDTLKDYATEARLAYDHEFLYVAVRCKHPVGRSVPPAKGRPRDGDLRAFDRLSLLLDLDRDYTTFFHLQVDQRGCVCDDCTVGSADPSWNPRWFVAVKALPDAWQLEAAIPFTELTGEPVTMGRAWACNLVRVIPGRGVQAWSLPADVQPRPEGMGLLMFAEEPKAPVKTAQKSP